MKISYNWLKEYIDTDLSPDEIAKILTDTGLEVEGIEKMEAVKGGLEGVFVGEVLSCEKHPDADRLKVTMVSVGAEPLQIVCGAANVATGQKVIVATEGCTLYPAPDQAFKIKKSKIRGVESNGMICAEDELGIGTSHDGILVLEPEAKVGQAAAQYFELEDDYVFEIGLTPNRADAMGHIGVARDLKAFLNVHENKTLQLKFPDLSVFRVDDHSLPINISVEDKAACPRYIGTTIKGVQVKASPAWLQKKLRAVGLSPINNVVDVSNFVMYELGTPLHAFDASSLNGNIIVRKARKGEKIQTLDEVERKLSEEDLLITNGDDPLCIAGIYGGMHSGVSDKTVNVFLESAYFNPVNIRKTAKRHGLNTDSSFRYERGVDPNLTDFALKRAALLIQELAGGIIAMEVTDTNPDGETGIKVDFSFSRCEKLIGVEMDNEIIGRILSNLDIEIERNNGDEALLNVPPYRVDVTREADVIEEVLRIYGFNKVGIPNKLNSSITHFAKPDLEKVQNTIAEMLVGLGFSEALNNSLTKSAYVEQMGGEALKPERNVNILNPLSQDLDVMRQSLLFNLMETIAHNQNRQHPDLRIFEFGKVYHKFESEYSENKRLNVIITGRREEESWSSRNERVSYFTLKGVSNALFERLGLDSFLSEKGLKNSLLQDGVQLYILKQKVGELGWVSSKVKNHFGIRNDVFVADLDWDAIVDSLKLVKIKYAELPKTFATRRDFSLLLDSGVSFAEIHELAKSCDKHLLREVGLFDVYEGKNLDEGKKSYAVSFKFQDNEKTLKDQQVDAIMDKIRKELETKLNAKLR